MYLWDAGMERVKKEEEGRWLRGYTTTRDAIISVEEAKAGMKAKPPDYAKPHLIKPEQPAQTPAQLEAQLSSLAVLYPRNIDIGAPRAG